jgi:hypothetical protein
LYLTVVAILSVNSFAATEPAGEDECPKGAVSELSDSIRVRVDDQTGITWYTDQTTPEDLSSDAFYLYVGKKGCDVWLRLRMQHASEKPLSVLRVQIKADEKTFEVSDPHFTHNSKGKVAWEWYDEPVTTDHLLMLFKITASIEAVVRFIGQYRPDEKTVTATHTITTAQKEALKNMLGAYHSLGGKL